jgi:CubicO group peptidase (beta-lactamase class C family)
MKARLLQLVCLTLMLWVALSAGAHERFEGHWEGAIEIPGGLEINIDLVTSGEILSGDISIPVQGINDQPLAGLVINDPEISFKMEGIPGVPSFSGTLSEDGKEITGTFTQGGQSFPFQLKAEASAAEKARAALAGFDDFVNQALVDWNVPGAAIAVVAGGEVVYAKGFGKRDLEKDLPMTPDSLFAIGSTTKAFTATVLGTLVDEGKVDWDTPVRTYLPWFRLEDQSTTEQITPRDLVTHRSGLPRHDLMWYNNHQVSREELVRRLAFLEPSATLRERFQYNNLMFMTAGYLSGELTGGTWEEAVRTRIFEPLGMTRSNFSVTDSRQDSDFAQPYRENDDEKIERIPFRNIDLVGPAGSINSSVNEMSRWLLFNLNRGKVGEDQLVNASTLADIHTPHMVTGTTSDRPELGPSSYGLGWFIRSYRGHLMLAHGGGIDGFITMVVLYPNDGLGLVAFTNIGSGLPGILTRHATDLVLGLEPIDWNGEALERRAKGREAAEEAETKKEATRVTNTVPSHALTDYAGDYLHPGYGPLSVTLADDTLSFTFNEITTPLDHWHYDVFNGTEVDGDDTFEDIKLLFRSDFNGNIAELTVTLEGSVDPIVFTKQPDARLRDPEYLQRFTGSYQLLEQMITIELSGDTLIASIPGQPKLTLVPDVSGRFMLKEDSSISIGFVLDEAGKATAINIYQPSGVHEAARVE